MVYRLCYFRMVSCKPRPLVRVNAWAIMPRACPCHHPSNLHRHFFENRGLDDKEKLPYFPYRDDGQLIHDTISNMVNEFVDQWVNFLKFFENRISILLLSFNRISASIHSSDQLVKKVAMPRREICTHIIFPRKLNTSGGEKSSWHENK